MKDIKIFLIGFLTCACLFLIMGQTMGGTIGFNKNGRYQITGTDQIYLIDTTTGDLYKLWKDSWGNPIGKFN